LELMIAGGTGELSPTTEQTAVMDCIADCASETEEHAFLTKGGGNDVMDATGVELSGREDGIENGLGGGIFGRMAYGI
jgi:hypothetical protein